MPEAYAVLFEVAKEINRNKDNAEEADKLASVLVKLGGVLGILQMSADDYLQATASESEEEVAEIEALIAKRNTARAEKDWAAADEARDALTALNVVLEDGPEGTTWRKA